MPEQRNEIWSDADAYERYVGRWSRPVARAFLSWLAVPDGATWADIGCGTGALTRAILAKCAPKFVSGVDRAEGFLAAARDRIADERVQFLAGDATRLPLDALSVDVAVSGLVMNFVPDHDAMVREMVRVTRPGGRVAAYVWDYAEGMQMMRAFWDAARAVRPQDAALDEAERFPLCQPGPLAALLRKHGLGDVAVRAIVLPMVFQSFRDYWEPFLGRQGAAPTYLASLDETLKERIRVALQARLVPVSDGPIVLSARAWAVQGTV